MRLVTEFVSPTKDLITTSETTLDFCGPEELMLSSFPAEARSHQGCSLPVQPTSCPCGREVDREKGKRGTMPGSRLPQNFLHVSSSMLGLSPQTTQEA